MKQTLKQQILSACVAAALPATAWAEPTQGFDDLGALSLESLGNIVTSVSRKPEDSFRAAAAIYVITNEDIRLSGATHIAELLRGVPGLDVARVDSSDWAISSRGFNGLFANKLLVQVDGRSIYTPLFAGVYWDVQNIVLEDVERIEIIRGPGATQWGSNAVNGIINVITKSAASTQGTYVANVTGNFDYLLTDVRYGGKVGDNAYYRAYGKFADRAATKLSDGSTANNDWKSKKSGFRTDWTVSDTRKVTLQGDVYQALDDFHLYNPVFGGTGIDEVQDKFHSDGINVLGRWEEKHSDTLQSTFQAYVDYQHLRYSALDQDLYTYDVDYQTAWSATERHNVMWGAGARMIGIDMRGSDQTVISNNMDRETILNGFVQDNYAMIPDTLYLTLGSKFEHNTFTGLEVEPSARLSWHPDEKQTVWAAISKAARIPSIVERTWTVNSLSVSSSEIARQTYSVHAQSENLVAYELGHRIKPVVDLTLDTTAFLNSYDSLTTFEPVDPVDAGGGNFYYPYQGSNLGKGHAFGVEESASWDVNSIWNLKANYSYLHVILDPATSQDPLFRGQAGDSAHHKFMIRSQLYLPHDVQLINSAYYVGRLPNQNINAYLRLDAQLIWTVTSNIECSLVLQNLLDNRHPEFGGSANGILNEIPRSVYGKVTLRY